MYEGPWDLANVLDEWRQRIWIDERGHVMPEGNLLIAESMLVRLAKLLAGGSRESGD